METHSILKFLISSIFSWKTAFDDSSRSKKTLWLRVPSSFSCDFISVNVYNTPRKQAIQSDACKTCLNPLLGNLDSNGKHVFKLFVVAQPPPVAYQTESNRHMLPPRSIPCHLRHSKSTSFNQMIQYLDPYSNHSKVSQKKNISRIPSIWAIYYKSLTWFKAIFGGIPLPVHLIARGGNCWRAGQTFCHRNPEQLAKDQLHYTSNASGLSTKNTKNESTCIRVIDISIYISYIIFMTEIHNTYVYIIHAYIHV